MLRIIGEKGTIEWNWTDGLVRLYCPDKKKWEEFKEDVGFKEEGYVAKENMYIEEMRSFVDAIKGRVAYPYSLEEDLRVLGLLEAAEQSSERKKHILLENEQK